MPASLVSHDAAVWSGWSERLRRDDHDALRAVFDHAYAPLVRFAEGLVRDPGIAADFAQEAFVRLWEHRASIDPGQSLRAWLFRTVRNLALNHHRDGRTRERLLDDAGIEATAAVPRPFVAPDAALEAEELLERVRAGIASLPPRQREALELSRFQGLSHAEIADVMSCAPRTVNNHLVRALEALRQHLAPVGSFVTTLLGVLS
ncbi:MAG: sigma-70 family RNA polymerase sigma factor [Gemmatimonadaceae bacterium]|jgi:RNA polymerase sigma-70 factor (ECF subfamily)|nr:sigma-70 family RNA polymerase sigma factor [Gemmatimonadaceae bacterium]